MSREHGPRVKYVIWVWPRWTTNGQPFKKNAQINSQPLARTPHKTLIPTADFRNLRLAILKPQPRAKPDGRGEGNEAKAAHQEEFPALCSCHDLFDTPEYLRCETHIEREAGYPYIAWFQGVPRKPRVRRESRMTPPRAFVVIGSKTSRNR